MDFDPRDYDSRDDDRFNTRGSKCGSDDNFDRDDARWPDRDREPPDCTFDPREPFTRDLHLLRGPGREIVRDRNREYTLRGSETRTLETGIIRRGFASGGDSVRDDLCQAFRLARTREPW